jgi:hypothetical protein
VVEVALGEAAVRLGVSRQRVHQLVVGGALPARRVAGRWIVEDSDVDRVAEGRRPGRRFSPRVVWGLIALLETGSAPELSPSERSRLRTQLRHRPALEHIALLCRDRADVHSLHAHPGSLPRALRWEGAVPTGAWAGAHAIADPGRVEFYLPASRLACLRRGLRSMDGGEDPNVIVRVPKVDAWPFPDGRAGPVTVALDLWDAGDVRSRRAADALFRRLLSEGLRRNAVTARPCLERAAVARSPCPGASPFRGGGAEATTSSHD